jgi:hypothetical protein
MVMLASPLTRSQINRVTEAQADLQDLFYFSSYEQRVLHDAV